MRWFFFIMIFMSDEEYMEIAYEEALKGLSFDEVPVGAIIVKDGKVIGRGHNSRERDCNISGHAEIMAIKEAEETLGNWRLDGTTLYVTLEPCLMCAGAILQARIHKVVISSLDVKDGAILSHYYVYDSPSFHERPLIYQGVLKEKCDLLLKNFFQGKRK